MTHFMVNPANTVQLIHPARSRTALLRVGIGVMALVSILVLALVGAADAVQAQGEIVAQCTISPITNATSGTSGHPVISDDGRTVVFWSTANLLGTNTDGNIEIFRADLGSGTLTQLTNTPGSILGGFNLSPTLNSNGDRTFFFSDRNLDARQGNTDANFEVFVYDSTALPTPLHQLTQTTGGMSLFPVTNGDGTVLALASDRDLAGKGTNVIGNMEIFLARLTDTQTITFAQITSSNETVINDWPTISNLGNRVAYASNQSGSMEIYLAEVQESGGFSLTQVTTSAANVTNEQPAISPDGRVIVHVSDKDGNREIYLTAIDSSGGITATQISQTDGVVVNEQPDVNGESNRVVFVSDRDGSRELFLYNVWSRTLSQITSASTGSSDQPSINRDGTRIAFVSDRNLTGQNVEQNTEVYLANCPLANLRLTGNAAPDPVGAGGILTYTWQVVNQGISPATHVVFTDALSAQVISPTVSVGQGSCTATDFVPGALPDQDVGPTVTCDLGTLGAGLGTTVTLAVRVPLTATGTVTNSAGVTSDVVEQDSTDNLLGLTTQIYPLVDLGISMSSQPSPVIPGRQIFYSIVVSNTGPAAASGAIVSDTFPAQIASVFWSCQATPGSSCAGSGSGNINRPVNLAAGGSLTYTVIGRLSTNLPDELVNVATVTAPPGILESGPLANRATDVNSSTPLGSSDLILLGLSAQPSPVVPGQAITYTLVVGNNGPASALGVVVSATLPATVTNPVWICRSTAQSSCAGSGAGGQIQDTVNILADGVLTYTVTGTVSSAGTGWMTATAQIEIPNGSTVVDLILGNNGAIQNTQLTPRMDLAVTTFSRPALPVPGRALTYTVVVANIGPSDAPGALVTTELPPAVLAAEWTCTATPGSVCAGGAGGTISDTVTVAAHGVLTYTIPGVVDGAARGTLTHTAVVSAPIDLVDEQPGDNSSVIVGVLQPSADLGVTQQVHAATVRPASPMTYTIVVSNTGPSTVLNGAVVDPIPAGIDPARVGWICLSTPGSLCTATGTGAISDTVSVSAGGVLTYTLVGDLLPSTAGTITNTVTVTASDPITDNNLLNNTALVTSTVRFLADLSISQTRQPSPVTENGTLTYTIIVANSGPDDIFGAIVSDTLPAEVDASIWVCTVSIGSACTANGTGSLNDELADIRAGGAVTFTITGVISATAGSTLVNTATVTVPVNALDLDPINNSATTSTPVVTLLRAIRSLGSLCPIQDPGVQGVFSLPWQEPCERRLWP